MNIILLSGGSGKRLWPLSNDTRSKQFLKLLKNEHGEYESMVQRVYKQIKTANMDANIVVATGASQVDSIRNQLGDNVDIVVEPERRDTFPAITLASAYLAFEKKIDLEEAVIVIPVDPYAQMQYFYTLVEMEKAILEEKADLVLMGIAPTYPSAKYGYIMPKKNENCDVFQVEKFMEKPSEKKAEELIRSGAVWNGGVFAFKLKYLVQIMKQYFDEVDFKRIRESYSQLNKISFDFEVVEKAKSVAVILYSGEWKDLGTWNTLSEEIEEESIGKVILGEGTKNTTIINELSIPLVVLGAENMIVAASPDGILVSDKKKSSYLKPYVDEIENRPMYEERCWGEYKVLDYVQYSDTIKSLTKHLTIYEGKSISYQKHKIRNEIWTIVDGIGELVIDGTVKTVQRGDVAYIVKGQKHCMRAVTELHFIEVQIGTELSEYDIERFDWEWGNDKQDEIGI